MTLKVVPCPICKATGKVPTYLWASRTTDYSDRPKEPNAETMCIDCGGAGGQLSWEESKQP